MSRIKINDLHFSYKSNEEVLKGLNLEFDKKSTAIIGQNGAGKSTFVKLLKGLLKPTAGDILINGINTKETTAAKLAKTIGLVFQNPNDQIFKNKVIDEIMFGPIMINMNEKEAMESSKKAAEKAGISNMLEKNPYDLSLSERKLISIASILAMDTDIIIFDEPTIAQDYEGKEKIKNIVRECSKEGKLVITITHDMDFVAETFERTIIFNQGQVILDSDTRKVFSEDEILKKAYLEHPNVTKLGKKLGIEKTFLNCDEFMEFMKSLH